MWKCLFVLLLGVAASSAGRLQVSISIVQQECAKYGKEDQIDAIRSAMTAMESCVESHMDSAGVGRVAVEALNEDNVAFFFRGVCSRKTEIGKCVAEFEEAVKPCTDPSSTTNNKADKETLARVIDKFCDTNAQKFTDLVKAGGLTCWREKMEELNKCFRPSPRFMKSYKNLSNLYSELCGYYSTLTGCYLTHLAQCNAPAVLEFASEIHDDLQKCTSPVYPPAA